MHSDFDGNIVSDGREALGGALSEYGYCGFFAEAFAAIANEAEAPARIVEERRGRYRVVRRGTGRSDGLLEEEAVASGKLGGGANSALELPAIGDWVALRPAEGGPSVIRALLPRRTAYLRKAAGDVEHDRIDAQVIAANVDIALIVAAAGRDWNPRRVERYLALSSAAGVEPFLVVTKSDMADDPAGLLEEARRVAPGSRIAMVCAPEGRGLASLAPALSPGSTIVLLGSSGAGKSTLLNALAGEKLARANEVREDDQRGRHTTTHRQLYKLGQGAMVIDTPGMRELQLWADSEDVDSAYPEIEALAEGCRFRDCRHENEPGCAVRAALESGGLEAGRYEGWRKLSKEAAFLRTKEDHSAKEAERRRWRSIEMSRRSFAKGEARAANKKR
jgi:ribosome biogenesis GTPase / thiamine phosphate phosphatase